MQTMLPLMLILPYSQIISYKNYCRSKIKKKELDTNKMLSTLLYLLINAIFSPVLSN